ncbi:MAG: heavy metal translocating P-type ATPase metal-binding domain-containing protein [Deltaproteobacteria bacterium]|nr:heavy metal translocating P-type ATPase metal-binding domain-containing protein [Deltaproteobacteria bacterium]
MSEPVDPRCAPYCCDGCAAIAALLRDDQLGRYYDLRTEPVAPVRAVESPRDLAWLEAFEAQLVASPGTSRIVLDLQGIQCTACVWLLEELFRREAHAKRIEINVGVGRVSLLVGSGFALRDYVTRCARLGYRFAAPSTKNVAKNAERSSLVARLGVCAALAMNAMIFALPLYLGLSEGPTWQAFRWIAWGLSTASVLVGGSVFFRSAIAAIRCGVLHLDVPIALGIAAAYTGSTLHHLSGHDGSSYFDTVAIFIALMLFGRWLQERAVHRNRAMLLRDDGVERMPARRIQGERTEMIRCGEIQFEDELLVAPGEPVPVDARLLEDSASLSLDWIQGESEPRAYTRDELVPAGAFNAGDVAVRVRSQSDFAHSPLQALLQTGRAEDQGRATAWWQRLARGYVAGVLLAATVTLAWWWHVAGLTRALEIATAVLVVTCPCAFGLAAPLAYEITQSSLRRAGLFVRSAGFLDRSVAIKRIVFDKTGTITTGTLSLANPTVLATLSAPDRAVLEDMVSRTSHPRAMAVRDALTRETRNTLRFNQDTAVHEQAGKGLIARTPSGDEYLLGASAWVQTKAQSALTASPEALVFARNGQVLCELATEETLRPDAQHELRALADQGYELWLLSGDATSRVTRTACALGATSDVDAQDPRALRIGVVGDCSPEDKARWLAAHDHQDTLFIGDGVNDALAATQVFCAGTPTIDRPFMAARTDFYFTTAGLRPIRFALESGRALAKTHRRNLTAALAYNLLVLALATSGRMSPLLCAIVMPTSTLLFLLATWLQLRPGGHAWT